MRRDRWQAVTPARLRYARWFFDAGWPVATIAGLFDLDAATLGAALGRGG